MAYWNPRASATRTAYGAPLRAALIYSRVDSMSRLLSNTVAACAVRLVGRLRRTLSGKRRQRLRNQASRFRAPPAASTSPSATSPSPHFTTRSNGTSRSYTRCARPRAWSSRAAIPLEERPGEHTDHAWHRGVWWGHGEISGVDFWRELGRDKTGRLVLKSPPETSGDTLTAEMSLQAPDGTSLGSVRQSFRFSGDASLRVIDATIAVRADRRRRRSSFGDTEDGGFGVRLSDAYRQDRGALLTNAQGLEGTENIWGKSSEWVDYSAFIDGRKGVAVFDHPGEPASPDRLARARLQPQRRQPVRRRGLLGRRDRRRRLHAARGRNVDPALPRRHPRRPNGHRGPLSRVRRAVRAARRLGRLFGSRLV